jgi:PleD family two-component response regulator
MNPSSQQFKILAVDDSPIYRKLVEQSLSQERYTLLFAKDGREALDLFAKHQPAVVITDWTMPDIEGLELCRRVRSDFQGVYSHLILLTSNADKEQVVEGLAAGADDYLTKPFHPGELLARVAVGRRIVELHREIQVKNRSLEELALTDALTGMPKRRAIDVWATRELSAAARHGFSTWVAMADLDHFKSINDTHGHDAGDTVLKSFATVLKSRTRESDMCGRLRMRSMAMLTFSFGRRRISCGHHPWRNNSRWCLCSYGRWRSCGPDRSAHRPEVSQVSAQSGARTSRVEHK